MSNILTHANDIVNNRSEEKERMYGPFFETMERATRIYNEMNPKEQISTVGMYKALVALKLAREAYHHKEDNLLDAVAYMGSMNDYIESNSDAVEEKRPSVTHILYYDKCANLQIAFNDAVDSLMKDDVNLDSKIVLHNFGDRDPLVLAERHFEVNPEDGIYKAMVWYNKQTLDFLNITYC
jgi:hypothetical protein